MTERSTESVEDERSREGRRFARSLDVFASRSAGAKELVVRRYADLEQSRRVGLVLATARRFFTVNGTDLGALLTLSMFCGLVPLAIIALAWFPDGADTWRSAVQRFGVDGAPAELADGVFASAQSNLVGATVLAAGSFAVVGYGVGRTLQVVFARAWQIEPTQGVRGMLRGASWFGLLILNVVFAEALLVFGMERPALLIVEIPAGLAVTFAFWLVTPRLLLDKDLGWRGLVPTAFAGVAVTVALRIAARFVVPGWIDYYSAPFGDLGVVLALIFWVWVVAYAWVAIACFGAVWWERTAGEDRVVALQLGLDGDGTAVDR